MKAWVGVFCLFCVASALGAQTGVYRAPGDTVYLMTSNPHRLYWVRGADTVGGMVASLTVTAQRWRADGTGFVVATRQSDLDVHRGVRADTLHVDASGRVAVPAGPAAAHAVDFSVRFPAGAPRLTVGMAWSDTTQSVTTGSSGPDISRRGFRVVRALRVTRMFDTLGTQVAEIASEGDVHYGDSWWADSTSKSYAWMDLAGPTHEMYWFDVLAGRLVARRWRMDLRGSGGRPTAGGTDTTGAGLIASETERVVPSETGRLLVRALPGRDTTYTFGTHRGKPTGSLFVETERVDTAGGRMTIESGFGRADGTVGTTLATFAHGRLRTYEATWTDSSAGLVRQSVVARGDTLTVHASDPQVAPRSDWAVADYGMDALLVPLLRTFEHDTSTHSIAVFRPTTRRWDVVRANVTRVGAGPTRPLVATLRTSGVASPVVLVISADDVLLYSEDTEDIGTRRVPRGDSHRNAEFQAITQMVRGAAR